MNFEAVWNKTSKVIHYEFFTVGDTRVTTGTFLLIAVILIGAFITSRLLQKLIANTMRRSSLKNEAIHISQRLTHYLIMIVAIVACLQTVGIDLSTMFAAGAVFAVGFGFAMQTIAQNFVSGLILLVERSIKPGDVLEIEGGVVKVEKMGIRATVVRTRNEEEVIVPNSTLVQGMVKNYTYTNASYLLEAEVGVSYQSDMRKVKEILERTANAMEWRDASKEPRVLMRRFGNSSVDFGIFVWICEPWIARRLQATLNEAIWFAFKEAGITIAFPQVDVHFDREVENSLLRMSSPAQRVAP